MRWRSLRSGRSSISEGDRWRRQRGRGRRRHQEAAGQHCHSPVALQPRHRAGAAPVWRNPALHPSPDPKPGALHDHALVGDASPQAMHPRPHPAPLDQPPQQQEHAWPIRDGGGLCRAPDQYLRGVPGSTAGLRR